MMGKFKDPVDQERDHLGPDFEGVRDPAAQGGAVFILDAGRCS